MARDRDSDNRSAVFLRYIPLNNSSKGTMIRGIFPTSHHRPFAYVCYSILFWMPNLDRLEHRIVDGVF